MSHQAVEFKNSGSGPYTSEAPGGSVGSARRKRCSRGSGGFEAPGGRLRVR